MKKIVLILIHIFSSVLIFSQQDYKNINFVISIDEDIVIGSVSQVKMIVNKLNKSKEIIKVNYVPGDLSIEKVDYEKLLSDDTESFYLNFNYTGCCNKEDNYEIELKKGWLELNYFVLKIYNTNRRKYKKMFEPLEGKEYTYEYYYPGGQVLRITKKKRGKCCN